MVGKFFKPMISLISNSINVFVIILLLIIVNPKVTIVITITLSLIYFIIYKINRNLLLKIGKERAKANEKTYVATVEAFNANKEIKLGGLENFYIKLLSS